MRCLAKAPADRPQSADEVLEALDRFSASGGGSGGGGSGEGWDAWRRIRGRRAAGVVAVLLLVSLAALLAMQRLGGTKADADPDEAVSVAVLPFANLSANRDNEYFADGMTDELINALANVQGLRVTARSSAFALKGQNLDAREVAQRLDVGRVVEGSVRRANEQLRVSAQMVDAANGKTLWSNSYQRNASDALGVQAELASAIAAALSPALRGPAPAAKGAGLTRDPEAYDLYLRGRYAWSQRTKESLLRGIDFFDRALRRDSGFALAYSGLADSYELLAAYGHMPSREGYVKARAAATKALSLDEGLGEAHATLAVIMFYNDWDFAGAEREFRRALELRPGIPYGHYAYGLFLVSRGRFDDGLAQMRQALKIDPLSLTMGANLGRALGYSRRYDEALAQNAKVVELDPRDGLSHVWLGVAYLGTRRFDDAAREFRVAASTREGTQLSLAGLAVAEARLGHRQQALSILSSLEQPSMRERVSSYAVAAAYAALGDADGAFRWLERGYAEHSHGMVFLAVDPLFDPIRGDPRFADLLKKMAAQPKAETRA
jgi:TolB-like protein/Tfp pilus assembly protein PilF